MVKYSSNKLFDRFLMLFLVTISSVNFSNAQDAKNETDSFMERTFIMMKPDGVQRGLIGEVIKRFEAKGLKLVAMKFMLPERHIIEEHYAHLRNETFFDSLIDYIMSGPVVPMVWEGFNAVNFGRDIIGQTKPMESPRGTIRGDFCLIQSRTVVHGSHTLKEAEQEIDLWFFEDEFVEWKPTLDNWINFSAN